MFVRMCVRMCVCHCVFIAFSFKGSNAIFLCWTTWLVGKKSKKRKSEVLLRTYNQHGHVVGSKHIDIFLAELYFCSGQKLGRYNSDVVV